jgi:hypothetical protein
MEQEFEAGLASHHQWRGKQGDPWRWIVWRIGSGPMTGTYAVGTFNHRWSDFDSPPVDPELALENFRRTVEPFVESTVVEHYTFLSEASNSPGTLPPRKFSITEMIEVKGGREREFLDAIDKITRAIKQAGWPNYYEWFRLETGGGQPIYARVRILWNWDDLRKPDLSLRQVLEKAYGKGQAEAIATQFHEAVQRRYNRCAVIKPELIYAPQRSEGVVEGAELRHE